MFRELLSHLVTDSNELGLPEFPPECDTSLPRGGVGGSSRFLPQVQGGDGGGGNLSSSPVGRSSSSESWKILVQDPDLRIGVDIRLAPKARAALGGTGAQERIDSMLEASPSGVPGPAVEALRC